MEPKIKLNGQEYPLVTPDLLTLGEAADAERVTGQGYDLYEGGALGLLALVYVSVKRVNPQVSIEDIRMLNGDDLQIETEAGDPVPLDSDAGSSGSGDSSSGSSSEGSDVSREQTQEGSGSQVS